MLKCPSKKYGNQNKALTKKAFFFEKKNQKTFARWVGSRCNLLLTR